MIIGIVPDPLNHPDWPQIKAFLTPAAERGNMPLYRDGWAVWAVYADAPTSVNKDQPIFVNTDAHNFVLVGAATAHLAEGGWGEVVLVGGKDHRRWIHELDEMIGRWLHDEGMPVVRAFGRKGWRKVLTNWNYIGEVGGLAMYERPLE